MIKQYALCSGYYYEQLSTTDLPHERSFTNKSVYVPTILIANKFLKFPTPFELLTLDTALEERSQAWSGGNTYGGRNITDAVATLTVGKVGNPYVIDYSVELNGVPSGDIIANLSGGIYNVRYYYHQEVGNIEPRMTFIVEYEYRIAVAENNAPILPFTITDCVNRVLSLAEPRLKGENPKYIFDGVKWENGEIVNYDNEHKYRVGSQAEKYDNVFAPPFTMTQCTLREQLKVIGGYIHCEPRLIKSGTYPNYTNTIVYDSYNKGEIANINGVPIKDKPHINESVSHAINEYCSAVDTRVQNVVNSLDIDEGSITEPNATNYRSLRTDTLYVRINESNGDFETQEPIWRVNSLKVGVLAKNSNSWAVEPLDLTNYVFEKSAYDKLSSYEEIYPYSKSYALYYEQGQKNIKGLWHKTESAVSQVLKGYTIVNILKSLGVKASDIEGSYPLLAVQINYTPFFNTRYQQHKPYIDGNPKRVLFYNQGENVVESTYYGENVKGAVTRLGNVDKAVTYMFSKLSSIPQPSLKYDDDYFISAVNGQIYPTYIKCTLLLSKDFNRLSQYIGINSNKRVYEVSEREAYERDTLYKDYIVISTNNSLTPTINRSKDYLGATTLNRVAWLFTGLDTDTNPITAVYCSFRNKFAPTKNIQNIILPVISSGFGNAMVFSWRYKDNYSAGSQSQEVPNSVENNITGYWSQDIPYGDYYGRGYYYQYSFRNTPSSSDLKGNALSYPLTNITPTDQEDRWLREYVYDKDSREISNFSQQLEFVTTDKNIIISSNLAKLCPLVKKYDIIKGAKLYFFNFKLDKFKSSISEYNEELTTSYDITVTVGELYTQDSGSYAQFTLTFATAPQDYQSWAICVPQEQGETKTYYDYESGKNVEITETKGDQILIGSNEQLPQFIKFTTQHNI